VKDGPEQTTRYVLQCVDFNITASGIDALRMGITIICHSADSYTHVSRVGIDEDRFSSISE
jgi:hypothetical protein